MRYKVELLKYRNNVIRTIRIFGQDRTYWNFDDIVDACESEDMMDIFNNKIQVYSSLFETNKHEFMLKTNEQEVVLDNEYSYMFDGGRLWGYIPQKGATLITQNQIEYLFKAEDGYSNDFKLWYSIEICKLKYEDIESINFNNRLNYTHMIYCIDANKTYNSSKHAAEELNDENITSYSIEKACSTGEKYGGHYWCYLSEFEDYINNYEEEA